VLCQRQQGVNGASPVTPVGAGSSGIGFTVVRQYSVHVRKCVESAVRNPAVVQVDEDTKTTRSPPTTL
jgi:hypothetical protein